MPPAAKDCRSVYMPAFKILSPSARSTINVRPLDDLQGDGRGMVSTIAHDRMKISRRSKITWKKITTDSTKMCSSNNYMFRSMKMVSFRYIYAIAAKSLSAAGGLLLVRRVRIDIVLKATRLIFAFRTSPSGGRRSLQQEQQRHPDAGQTCLDCNPAQNGICS